MGRLRMKLEFHALRRPHDRAAIVAAHRISHGVDFGYRWKWATTVRTPRQFSKGRFGSAQTRLNSEGIVI